MRYFLGASFLLLGLYLGTHTALNSWDGTYFVSNSKYIRVRNPANVEKLAPFSELKGKAWDLLSRDRLLAEAFPIKEADKTGFVFGHFITQDADGKKFFACDLYNKVQLSFVAEGIMEGGEFTKMTVEAPCRATADLNSLEPIWVPHTAITSQVTSPNLKLDFPLQDLHISFSNLSSEWPHNWVLQEVKLLRDGGSSTPLRVDAREIFRTAKRPMTISW